MSENAPDKLEVCILAAGLGKRMKSQMPKVLHELAGRPMLAHLLDSVTVLEPTQVHVVIGKGADKVEAAFEDRKVNWVLQSEQLGTGHAVQQAMPHINADGKVLILLGDAPLVTTDTMQRMIDEDCDLGILTVEVEDPFNYGRIIRGEGNNVLQIIEERDADDHQKHIREINTGVMVARTDQLRSWLEKLDTNNDQGEYLLTDIVQIAEAEDCKVHAVRIDDENEAKGVNTLEQLAVLESAYRLRQARSLMAEGVHVIDPLRIDVRGTLSAGADVTVDINCVFEGECRLGERVRIGANCFLRNVEIGDDVEIRANTVLEDARIEDDCSVGPFARVRPGTHLKQGAAIGNFVETKNAVIGAGSKASHLSYLGDTTIGNEVNIGAGTITCNYDGVLKHQTRIEDNVFVGSNTALVAPVTIGEGSTIGAGSTITSDVAAGELAVGRGRQKSIKGWKGPRS
jgi:bifunctional UDP-N-acetylglucosamine pyrophosphorylase/glucosamine-1-phosphate N-acetyltransferase